MALNLGNIDLESGDESGRFVFSWLTLRFRDRLVERAYAHNDIEKSLPLIRVTLFFATLLYASFGVLDYHVTESALGSVWFIRFFLVLPVIIMVVIVSFTRLFKQIAQFFLSITMLTTGAGVVAMTAVTHEPASTNYYAGLIMVVIYGSTLVRLQFVNSALISIGLVAAYQWVAISYNPISLTTLINNNFFLIMATVVGIFASYIQELYVRLNYVSTRLLIEEKGKSEQLLAKSEAANHAKSEFLAVVSHELRTPLNAIIGFSEFLKMEMFGPLGSSRYKSYSEDIYRSGQHLLHIINDILDLSRAEANKLEITEEKFNLGDMINGCLRMFRNKAAEEGLRLSHRVSEDLHVSADQRLMNQVVINLLSNAIKFTPTGGAITVTAFSDPNDNCSIQVIDTGIGIAEENINRVLEPFIQVESASARSHEGLGLGLPLVKRIMNLHGGTIEIESTLGKGTTVTVTLPGWRRCEWRDGQEGPDDRGGGEDTGGDTNGPDLVRTAHN
jgi:signal transduction histidine kinase